ncbi:hypothetical protein Plhal304r1_c064g0151481 [Plasmopara halstedii]
MSLPSFVSATRGGFVRLNRPCSKLRGKAKITPLAGRTSPVKVYLRSEKPCNFQKTFCHMMTNAGAVLLALAFYRARSAPPPLLGQINGTARLIAQGRSQSANEDRAPQQNLREARDSHYLKTRNFFDWLHSCVNKFRNTLFYYRYS